MNYIDKLREVHDRQLETREAVAADREREYEKLCAEVLQDAKFTLAEWVKHVITDYQIPADSSSVACLLGEPDEVIVSLMKRTAGLQVTVDDRVRFTVAYEHWQDHGALAPEHISQRCTYVCDGDLCDEWSARREIRGGDAASRLESVAFHILEGGSWVCAKHSPANQSRVLADATEREIVPTVEHALGLLVRRSCEYLGGIFTELVDPDSPVTYTIDLRTDVKNDVIHVDYSFMRNGEWVQRTVDVPLDPDA